MFPLWVQKGQNAPKTKIDRFQLKFFTQKSQIHAEIKLLYSKVQL